MKYFLTLAAAVVFLSAAGCGNQNQKLNAGNTNQTPPKPDKLKVADVVTAFRAANLPLNMIEFFNAASDPEKHLGTPGFYIGKAKWKTTEKMIHMILEYASDEDLQAEKLRIGAAVKPGATELDYVYTHKNILVRINQEMLPETAAKYEQVLKSL